ncbi:renin receptor-like [Scaptodrosophila lebanonensis]|uniref:Renin receptor-like n=1 Tax=Drosophila lebanonensis TaxID=7225 RepID=A0A6J2T976_DROLE|nr:renin receptor-like [Scaptodrosophila lebanonensis]
MFRNCVIFSLLIVAIHASGELTVLSSPKGISFKGNDALESYNVGDVLYAALGNAVNGESDWSGMIISDPFNLAKCIIAVHVQGTRHIETAGTFKTYDLVGSSTSNSLTALAADLEAANEPVCDINFEKYEDGIQSFKSCFGDLEAPTAKPTKHLSLSLHSADKQFLQQIGYINAASENLAEMLKTSNVLLVRLSVEGIAKGNGDESEALEEANKLISAAIGRLQVAAQKSSTSVLFIQTTDEEVSSSRSKRDVVPPNNTNPYSSVEYYDYNYPVIFNIILWFMVVFCLALLAICYAIGSMDPGRDSIIYRMTSTRMKKDN